MRALCPGWAAPSPSPPVTNVACGLGLPAAAWPGPLVRRLRGLHVRSLQGPGPVSPSPRLSSRICPCTAGDEGAHSLLSFLSWSVRGSALCSGHSPLPHRLLLGQLSGNEAPGTGHSLPPDLEPRDAHSPLQPHSRPKLTRAGLDAGWGPGWWGHFPAPVPGSLPSPLGEVSAFIQKAPRSQDDQDQSAQFLLAHGLPL